MKNDGKKITKTAKEYFTKADKFLNVGNLNGALANLDKAIHLDPNLAGAWNSRGMVWSKKGEHDRAISDFSQAIHLNPSDVSFWHNRGVAWKMKREYDKALTDFDEAIRLDPNLAVAWNSRGNTWFEKGEYGKAIADYDEVIRLKPDTAEAWSSRGSSHSKAGNFYKAIVDCNEAIRLKPDYATAWSNRGNTWTEIGEHEKAISDLNEAIRLESKLAIAWNNRGYAWTKRGEHNKAISDLDESIRLKPDDAGTWNNLGVAWSDKGDYEKAISNLNEAIRLNPNLANAWNNRGYAWYQKEEYDNAIKNFEQAIHLSPDYTAAINNLIAAKEALVKNKEKNRKHNGAEKPLEPDAHEFIIAKLDTIQNATPSAEHFEWNPRNRRIRFRPESIANTVLLDNSLEKLHDEILYIKNNTKLSNTHAALIPMIEQLESRLKKYKNSPHRIHDEIEIMLMSVQWFENEGEIPRDLPTQRFKKILNDCILDIRGDVPEVQEAVKKRKILHLTQLSDDEQDWLSSITEDVGAYIEEEHIKQDMRQDVEAFRESQNIDNSQEKISKIYRWTSRLSRMLRLLLKHVPGFLKDAKSAVISESIKVIFKAFGF